MNSMNRTNDEPVIYEEQQEQEQEVEDKSNTKSSVHSCYMLFNNKHNATYIGYTNNLKRRIRQHNGFIKGGARFTTLKKKQYTDFMWQFLAVVFCPQFTPVTALSCEWHLKHPFGRKRRPNTTPVGRLKEMIHSLENPKFEGYEFEVYIHPSFQTKVKLTDTEHVRFHFQPYEDYLECQN